MATAGGVGAGEPGVAARLRARIRPFVLGNLGTWLVCIGMFSAMMFVPLELQYVGGYTELAATNALLPLTVTAIVVGARSAAEVTQDASYLTAAVPDELFAELAAEGLIPGSAGPS